MFRRSDPTRLRYLRGNILYLANLAAQGEALNPDDPMSMGKTVLCQTMENLKVLPSNEDLRGALRYLEAKRYIAVKWARDGSGDWDHLTLMPGGIDLVEGSITDAGVLFNVRR